MTSTEQFIKDAIEGGWKYPLNKTDELVSLTHFSARIGRTPIAVVEAKDGWKVRLNVAEILLDPKAWQAVGKKRGWNTLSNAKGTQVVHSTDKRYWLSYWHQFIDYLADGKTIEESLTLIT